MDRRLVKVSKFLSLVLRHRPEKIGITLDEEGWIGIDELLAACERSGRSISREDVMYVVAHNDKQRFTVRDGRIRARQGHSIAVELGLKPVEPPEYLYHGTAQRSVESIRHTGLKRMNRQHVHLSRDVATARRVGIRHGRPAILKVQASAMHSDGYPFFLAENGVWLTEEVPHRYLEEIEGAP